MANTQVRVLWYRQCETAGWASFSDIQCEIIEDGFHGEKETVELDCCLVDLKHRVVLNKDEQAKQQSIKRVENMHGTNVVRHSRFSSYEALSTRSFRESDNNGDFRGFVWDWYEQQYKPNEPSLFDIVEKAASGLQVEGASCGKVCEAKWLAHQLLQVKSKKAETVGKLCVALYTRECFLYGAINTALRNDNRAKMDTLGPFCYLLKYVGLLALYPEYIYERVVYRSMSLDEEHIRQYRNAVADPERKRWLAFSSTTKNRQVAEHFHGNALFVIQLPTNEYSFGIDISAFSNFPEEEEVLLPTQICFRVEKVEFDETRRIHIIYLNMKVYS